MDVGDIGLVGHDAALAAIDALFAGAGGRRRRLPAESEPGELLAFDALIVAAIDPRAIQRWRAGGVDCPVLWLVRSDAHLAAQAIASGADDLVVPPITADELRLRVTVARSRRAAVPIVLPDRVVDLATATVLGPQGSASLTPTEVRLLSTLAGAAGRPVRRAELLKRVWGYAVASNSRAVDNAIRRLRTKLEVDPARPELLLTVHRIGYRLRVPERSAPDLRAPVSSAASPTAPAPWQPRPELEAAVGHALATHGAVWLWGPAGAGKSRLIEAIRTTGDLVRVDGRDLDRIPRLLARLAVRLDVSLLGDDPADRIGRALAGRGASTLVIDGTTAPPAALLAILERWRAAAPVCRFVVTARARADAPYAVRVGPLSRDAASALILEIAGRTRALPAGSAALAARIVEGTDRLAQTMVLVAGGLRYSTLETVAAGLADGLPTGAESGAAAAWFDRTWQGLDAWRRSVLVAASQFPETFDLLDLAALKPVPDPMAPDLSVVLDDLVGRALMEVDGAAPPPRLRLLPSIRERVRHHSADGWRTLVERHAARCVHVGRQAADDLAGPDPAGAARRLGALLSVLDALSRRPDVDIEHRVEAALAAGALYARQRVLDEHQVLLATLAAAPMPAALARRLVLQRASLSFLGGRFEQARALLDTLDAPDFEPRFTARRALLEARLALRTGTLDVAERAIEVGLAAAVRAGDRRLEGELLDRAATLARRRGALHDAARHLDRAAVVLDRARAVWAGSMVTSNRALLALEQGDPSRAEALWRRLVDRAVEFGLSGTEMEARVNLGAALLAGGAHAAARHHLDRALEAMRRRGLQREQGLVLYHLGRLAADRGRLPRAARVLDEARRLARASDDERVAAAAGLWGGMVAHRVGRPAQALQAYADCAAPITRLAPSLRPLWSCAHELARRADGIGHGTPGRLVAGLDPELERALFGVVDADPTAAQAIAHRSLEARMVLSLAGFGAT